MALTQRSHWNLLLEQISLAVKAALTCGLAHWPSYLLVPGEGKAWNTLHKCWINCRNRCSTDLWIESEDCPIAASWCFLKVPILKESRVLRTSAKGLPACPCSILPLRKGRVVHATAAYHNLPAAPWSNMWISLKQTQPRIAGKWKVTQQHHKYIHKYQKHSKTTTSPTTWSRNSPGISVWTSTHYFRLRSQSRIHCCFQTWHGQLSQQVGALAQDHFSGGNC